MRYRSETQGVEHRCVHNYERLIFTQHYDSSANDFATLGIDVQKIELPPRVLVQDYVESLSHKVNHLPLLMSFDFYLDPDICLFFFS